MVVAIFFKFEKKKIFLRVIQNVLLIYSRKIRVSPNLVAHFRFRKYVSQKTYLNDFLQTTYSNSLLDVISDKIVTYYIESKFGMPVSGFASDSGNEKRLKGFSLNSINKLLFPFLNFFTLKILFQMNKSFTIGKLMYVQILKRYFRSRKCLHG